MRKPSKWLFLNVISPFLHCQVIARDANEFPLHEDELSVLPEGSLVHLYTAEEEN